MDLKSTAQLATTLSNLLDKVRSLPPERDNLFEACKADTVDLVKDFSENPYREDLILRGSRIINRFNEINFDKSKPNDYEVARTAAAVVAGRVRRTHFAAYAAGQYRNDPKIGFKYKNWMHNVAANGAISLHSCINEISDSIDGQSELSKSAIQMFSYAAREDARVFIDISEQIDPNSCLSKYNRAKLDILTGRPDFIAHGIHKLITIDGPDNDDHVADYKWHIDNFHSFENIDQKVRIQIETHFEHKLQSVLDRLESNAALANNLLIERGNESESKTYNQLAIAATSVGAVVTGALYLKPEIAAMLREVLEIAMAIFETNSAEHLQTALAGDGGLPFSSRAADAAFGDGGLPFITA